MARAGNVIGGGDWAKDRIIVDCVKAFSRNEVVEIRSPKATRPWQHVLEPLSGYLNLGQYLYEGKVKNGEPFNFGPRAEQTKTVFQLVQDLAELWGLDRNTAARLTGNVPFEEATLLKLNCDKALAYLDWHSTLHYEECVHFIADWYKAFLYRCQCGYVQLDHCPDRFLCQGCRSTTFKMGGIMMEGVTVHPPEAYCRTQRGYLSCFKNLLMKVMSDLVRLISHR